MEIRPILSSLRRHKTAATLIVLEIALSCAILCNAIFLVGSRVEHMQRTSGIVEDELVFLSVSSLSPDRNADVARREDLAALAAVPGVKAASSVNQIPYGGNVWASGVKLDPDQADSTLHVSTYMDDGHLVDTFGLTIRQGQGFAAEDYQDMSVIEASDDATHIPGVILSRSLAERLFPDDSALGRKLYIWGKQPSRVIGVMEDLLAPGSGRTLAENYHTVLFPVRVAQGNYALRTDPQRREAVLQAAVAALNAVDSNRIINERTTVTDMRHAFHSRDRAVVWLLLTVCVCLLAVTAFGIVGLASFWVQQRTRQIGVRRALGATRGQILRYFQIENLLLVSIGIALGMVLAYAVNHWLMSAHELSRLPLHYLPIGALVLWLLGQVAVLGPARRAARISPAIATRTA